MPPHAGFQALLSELEQQPTNSPRNQRVRDAVRLRAGDACEYCLHPTSGQFHVEHIIPQGLWQDYAANRLSSVPLQPGRRGPDHISNFAWSCPFCNQGKQERVSHRLGQRAHRFFDPRHDVWPDHFVFLHNYLIIVGVTPIGQATVAGLSFNAGEPEGPLGTRHDTILNGRYPPEWARTAYGL